MKKVTTGRGKEIEITNGPTRDGMISKKNGISWVGILNKLDHHHNKLEETNNRPSRNPLFGSNLATLAPRETMETEEEDDVSTLTNSIQNKDLKGTLEC